MSRRRFDIEDKEKLEEFDGFYQSQKLLQHITRGEMLGLPSLISEEEGDLVKN